MYWPDLLTLLEAYVCLFRVLLKIIVGLSRGFHLLGDKGGVTECSLPHCWIASSDLVPGLSARLVSSHCSWIPSPSGYFCHNLSSVVRPYLGTLLLLWGELLAGSEFPIFSISCFICSIKACTYLRSIHRERTKYLGFNNFLLEKWNKELCINYSSPTTSLLYTVRYTSWSFWTLCLRLNQDDYCS